MEIITHYKNMIKIENIDGKLLTSSLNLAEVFEKNHKDVLRDIRMLDCSDEFSQRNFAPSSYLSDQNKELPQYLMTKDGFTFLAMGYTGAKAAQFKEAYIKQFNEMEEKLRKPQTPLNTFDFMRMMVDQMQKMDAGLTEVKKDVAEIKQTQITAQQDMLMLPQSTAEVSDMTIRAQLVRLVRDYVQFTGVPHSDAWNNLYREFKYRERIDLKVRAKNTNKPALDVAEKLGQIDKLYALAQKLFGNQTYQGFNATTKDLPFDVVVDEKQDIHAKLFIRLGNGERSALVISPRIISTGMYHEAINKAKQTLAEHRAANN